MARSIRYHISFQTDLANRVRWLRRNRPPEQVANLRRALERFKDHIGTNPGIGTQVEVRGTRSYRIFSIGSSLPYVIWYYYDTVDPKAPVWLVMLLHEKQDRERYSPDLFE